MANIENEIHLAKERSKTDAEFYKVGYLKGSRTSAELCNVVRIGPELTFYKVTRRGPGVE